MKKWGKINIEIKRNETLIKKRNLLLKNKISLYNNILIIYLDIVSRKQFNWKLSKIGEILKPYFSYNKNNTELKIWIYKISKIISINISKY